VVEAFKHEQHDKLVALCREAGIVEAEGLADALGLLLEGARVIASFSAAGERVRGKEAEGL
jgi:hypothetical protein